jgi:hypothetical protein
VAVLASLSSQFRSRRRPAAPDTPVQQASKPETRLADTPVAGSVVVARGALVILVDAGACLEYNRESEAAIRVIADARPSVEFGCGGIVALDASPGCVEPA